MSQITVRYSPKATSAIKPMSIKVKIAIIAMLFFTCIIAFHIYQNTQATSARPSITRPASPNIGQKTQAKKVSPSITKSTSPVVNAIPLPQAKVVGALHHKWPFYSDHLPTGAQIDDFKIMTWNVMNTDYMDNITHKNGARANHSAGLNGSAITTAADRDQKIVDMIAEMAKTYSIIAIQEANPILLLSPLETRLKGWKIVKGSGNSDCEVIMFKESQFKLMSSHTQSANKSPQALTVAKLKDQKSGLIYQIVTTRLNGNPALNAASRQELYAFLKEQTTTSHPLIFLGDMNCEAHKMRKELDDQFHVYNLYNNHIGADKPKQKGKIYDHIWVAKNTASNLQVKALLASNFGQLVATSADILN